MCIAAAIGGAAVVGAGATMYAGNRAAGAQKDAANQANATLQQQNTQNREDLSPYRTAGNNALSALQDYYGIGGHHADLGKILSGLPGYRFEMQSGTQAVNQNLAARGLLQSGAAGKALTQYGQGLGQQYGAQYAAGLQGLVNQGENAANQTGIMGSNAANNMGANQTYAGNAAGQGYINSANAINGGLQGLAGAYGQYQGMQQGSSAYGGGGGWGAPSRNVEMDASQFAWTGMT